MLDMSNLPWSWPKELALTRTIRIYIISAIADNLSRYTQSWRFLFHLFFPLHFQNCPFNGYLFGKSTISRSSATFPTEFSYRLSPLWKFRNFSLDGKHPLTSQLRYLHSWLHTVPHRQQLRYDKHFFLILKAHHAAQRVLFPQDRISGTWRENRCNCKLDGHRMSKGFYPDGGVSPIVYFLVRSRLSWTWGEGHIIVLDYCATYAFVLYLCVCFCKRILLSQWQHTKD